MKPKNIQHWSRRTGTRIWALGLWQSQQHQYQLAAAKVAFHGVRVIINYINVPGLSKHWKRAVGSLYKQLNSCCWVCHALILLTHLWTSLYCSVQTNVGVCSWHLTKCIILMIWALALVTGMSRVNYVRLPCYCYWTINKYTITKENVPSDTMQLNWAYKPCSVLWLPEIRPNYSDRNNQSEYFVDHVWFSIF